MEEGDVAGVMRFYLDGKKIGQTKLLYHYRDRGERKRRRMTVEERVQKILSAYGVCSRREAERLMTAGEVLVNGTLPPWATGGSGAGSHHRPRRPPRAKAPEHCYVMLHKPRGYVTTLSGQRESLAMWAGGGLRAGVPSGTAGTPEIQRGCCS